MIAVWQGRIMPGSSTGQLGNTIDLLSSILSVAGLDTHPPALSSMESTSMRSDKVK